MAIKPSPCLALLLLLSHTIAASVVGVTAVPWAVKLAAFLLVVLSLSYYLVRDVLMIFPTTWREFSLEQGNVSIVVRGGPELAGEIVSGTVVSPYFVILRVGLKGCRRQVSRIIFPDATGRDAFRELCVYLKFIQ